MDAVAVGVEQSLNTKSLKAIDSAMSHATNRSERSIGRLSKGSLTLGASC